LRWRKPQAFAFQKPSSMPVFGIGGLPAANSNYPSAADSNGNSGIPAAALQA
jgi:hypothetical protein